MANVSLDDDDDAWSYSFPPSTDSLPLVTPQNGSDDKNSTKPILTVDTEADQGELQSKNGPGASTDKNLITKPPALGPSMNYGEQVETLRKGEYDDIQSQDSSASSGNGVVAAAELRRNRLATLAPISRTSSRSSNSLQSPFLVKSTPANPLTTKQDANSILSKDNLASGFEASLTNTTTSAKSSLLHHKSNSTNTAYDYTKDLDKTPDRSEIFPKSQNLTPSPKIIAYRKSKKSISEPFTDSPTSPKEGGYDPKLYTDQPYKDTQYLYATMKRNTEFHQLFRSLDLTDRLLDDFSCALSREILLQGRIYVSEHYVCFNSNLLGWVTNLVIRFSDIVRFEKKSTAGLFPNGILIETEDAKHTFASFIARDTTYDFMKVIWEKSQGDHFNTLKITQEELVNQTRKKSEEESLSSPVAHTPKIESYIMQIDGDDDEDDENADVSDGELKDTSAQASEIGVQEVSTKVLKFKEESRYKNSGPDTHTSTDASKGYTPDPNEIELVNEVIDAPLGIVFDILFGSTNTSFHKGFLESHDGSEVTEYDEFLPMDEDPTMLERSYTYRRALGYSIGPKSTKCEVSEVIEHQNFADYIIVLTSTTTPDVPSGQSFSVKTRYVLTWTDGGKTNLLVSFYIKWTGRSWIKGVIEKQSLSGQTATAKDLIVQLKEEISRTTYYVDGPNIIKPIEPVARAKSVSTITLPATKVEQQEVVEEKAAPFTLGTSTLYIIGYFLVFALFFLLIFQLRIARVLKETNELVKSQVLLNSHLIQTLALKDGGLDVYSEEHDNDQFWDWVRKKYGKKLSRIEKIQFLTYQINVLSTEHKTTKKDKKKKPANRFSEIKQKVGEINYQGSLYVDEVRDIIGELI